MKSIFGKLIDHQNEASLATALRRKRFALLHSHLVDLPRPIEILDIGGEQRFWELMGYAGEPDIHVTLLNIAPQRVTYPNFRHVLCDATDTHIFENRRFEVVFSNSTIEHLGRFADQRRMAENVRRLGKGYFIQTPNRYFPLEPHFLVPFFQFLPLGLQIRLTRSFNLGWYRRIPNHKQAKNHVLSHRLLGEKEMRLLFPEGKLYREKFFGLTKSLIAYYFA